MNKQLFFSRTWQNDKLNRNNHMRVRELAEELYKLGWSYWFDEDNMISNIDAAMAKGIDNAEVVIICLTEQYFIKVNETANNPHKRDNCLKEWTYAIARNKLMIPVIMDISLCNISDWPPGIISLYFGSTLYINASTDNLKKAAYDIDKLLLKYNLKSMKSKNMKYMQNSLSKLKNLLYISNNQRKSNNRRKTENYIQHKNSISMFGLRRNTTGQLKEINI